MQLHRLQEAVPGVTYLHFFGANGARPPCATNAAGVVMEIYDYRQVDPTVERIVRFLLHDDLDTEVALEVRSIPSIYNDDALEDNNKVLRKPAPEPPAAPSE